MVYIYINGYTQVRQINVGVGITHLTEVTIFPKLYKISYRIFKNADHFEYGKTTKCIFEHNNFYNCFSSSSYLQHKCFWQIGIIQSDAYKCTSIRENEVTISGNLTVMSLVTGVNKQTVLTEILRIPRKRD